MSRWQAAGAKLKTATLLGMAVAPAQQQVRQSRGDGGSGWLEASSAKRTGLGSELLGDVFDFEVPKDQGSLCLTLNEGACKATGVRQIVIEYMPEKVSIEGMGLEPLYRAILQHRARSVRVNGDARGFGPKKLSIHAFKDVERSARSIFSK